MNDSDLIPIKVDVKVDSKDAAKVLNKFIDTIKAPFAYWAKNKEPIKQAEAETKAALIRAKSIGPIAEELEMNKAEAISLILRADQREQYDKIRQQRNIEAIVQGSIDVLPPTAKDDPVEEDWITAFFEDCKNVSEEKLQSLWSHILAGEVAEPGSYPKRTLSFIKTLSQSEADLFTKFCSILCCNYKLHYVHIRLTDEIHLTDYGIDYSDIMELESLGLLRFDANTVWYFDAPEPAALSYFNETLYLYPKIREGRIQFSAFPLTNLGNTLARISGANKNDKYKLALIEKMSGNNLIISDLPPRKW